MLAKVWAKVPNYTEEALELCEQHKYKIFVANVLVLSQLITIEAAFLVYLGVLVHEGGHYLAQRRQGYMPSLYVFPILAAGVEEVVDVEESPSAAFLTYISGPFAGLLFSASLYIGHLATGNFTLLLVSGYMAAENAFQLVPMGFLDGGKARKSLRVNFSSIIPQVDGPNEDPISTYSAVLLGNIVIAALSYRILSGYSPAYIMGEIVSYGVI